MYEISKSCELDQLLDEFLEFKSEFSAVNLYAERFLENYPIDFARAHNIKICLNMYF